MVTTVFGIMASALFPQTTTAAPQQIGGATAPAEIRQETRASAPTQADSALDKRVTKSLDSVTLKEALSALAEQGLSFVVIENDKAQNVRITIHVVDQPLRDVMDAIASAYGGHWSRKGSVYILSDGRNSEAQFAPFEWRGFDRNALGQHELPKDLMKKDSGAAALVLPKELMKDDEMKLQILNPEIQKKIESATQEAMKARDMNPEMQKKIESAMQEAMKARDMNPEMQKKIESAMQEAMKARVLDSTLMGEPKMLSNEMRLFSFPSGQNFDKLLGSLTPQQKSLMAKRGYLTPKDLTKTQLGYLGKLPEGADWSVSISIGGKTLKLRSK